MKRGQAAIEFLTTYGWAILVLVAAMSTLAYFGVLSPSKYVPERCDITQGFACVEYKLALPGVLVGADSEVEIHIRNDMGKPVTIQANTRNIICSDCVGNTECLTCPGFIDPLQCSLLSDDVQLPVLSNTPFTVPAGGTFYWRANPQTPGKCFAARFQIQ